jgi:iron(III) transport system permease protein
MTSLAQPAERAGWTSGRRTLQPLALPLALVAAALVALPVLGVFGSIAYAPGSLETLQHLAATVIPRAALETCVLVVLVMLGVTVLGTTTAWLVAAHEFPGRRSFEWALLLPLAMPGYIVAYAYTDVLQFSGPVQSALRASFGWTRADYWFPEIRSLPGAAFVFSVVLYPYVYLLARTAFLSRTASMIDAARSLGLSPWRTWLSVNLPLARPAVAAGALLAMMETLADYGAAAYFGLQTFTTSIYRAWFGLGDRLAASQLAAVLLVLVLIVIAFERRLRGQARYFTAPNAARPAARTPLRGPAALLASAACLLPLVAGFVLPTAILVRLLLPTLDATLWQRYLGWLGNSVLIAAAAAVLTLAAVLLLAYLQRLQGGGRSGALLRGAVRIMSLGYAVPGVVIAVGVLVPLAAFDNRLDAWLRASLGVSSGLLLTGTIVALLYAYLVRYFAVAQQPVDAGLARITPAMDASARSLGAGPLEVFRRVHLPLLSPSLLAAALLVFVDVMKELPATLVLRPFNFDTLAVIAYQMAADERLGEAALPSLTIVLMGLAPVILLSRAIGKASGAAGGVQAT